MNKETLKIVEAIGNDILTLATIIMEDDSISINDKVGKNTLKNSALKSDMEQKIQATGNPIIQTFFNHYVVYLEWNRPKKYGKQPPIDCLRDWASKNGIPTDNSTLWLISRAIWRDGHSGRAILATLANNIEELFEKQYFDELFTAIITELKNFFKD